MMLGQPRSASAPARSPKKGGSSHALCSDPGDTADCYDKPLRHGDCDRTCLKTTLDSYLNAVTKHDSSAAPLFIGFRQTENAVVTKLGTGVWKSVTALGQMQRRYFDPVTEQAAYFGIVEESGTPAVVTVRLGMTGRGARGGAAGAVTDCTSGLATINIQNVAARRYPIVDEEAQTVMAMAIFILPAELKN